jgi:hypothetical protein
MVRVRSAELLTGYQVRVIFTNGVERIVDLSPYLHGPIFDALRTDSHLFRSFTVDPVLGTIVWPNGADIDPDVLYGNLAPAWQNTERSSNTRAS